MIVIKIFTRNNYLRNRETCNIESAMPRIFFRIPFQREAVIHLLILIPEANVYKIIVDLFLAGGETTGTSLVWALLYMIMYPDVQSRCFNEITMVKIVKISFLYIFNSFTKGFYSPFRNARVCVRLFT
jgi:hypothetical protein